MVRRSEPRRQRSRHPKGAVGGGLAARWQCIQGIVVGVRVWVCACVDKGLGGLGGVGGVGEMRGNVGMDVCEERRGWLCLRSTRGSKSCSFPSFRFSFVLLFVRIHLCGGGIGQMGHCQDGFSQPFCQRIRPDAQSVEQQPISLHWPTQPDVRHYHDDHAGLRGDEQLLWEQVALR